MSDTQNKSNESTQMTLTREETLAATIAAMKMHLLRVTSTTSPQEADKIVRRCAKDVRIYLPQHEPTRLQVKVAVKMYFEHLYAGRTTLPLPEEVQEFHAENGSL